MAASLARRSVQSSELSRNSAAVFIAAEEGPVDITRRDGEDFVLMTARRAEQDSRALTIAFELVAASTTDGPSSLIERLRGPYPWLEFLTADERGRFVREIVDVTRACAAVRTYDRLLATFEAWHASAVAIAQGYTPDDALEWLDEPVRVPDPREDS